MTFTKRGDYIQVYLVMVYHIEIYTLCI